MKVPIILTLTFVLGTALASDGSFNNDLTEDWTEYKKTFSKVYADRFEEYSRRAIWESTVKYIQEHNLRFDLGQHSYYLGVNQFSDLSDDEFKEKHLGLVIGSSQGKSAEFLPPLNMPAIPPYVNWVTQGFVTPVKNQGACGSCWTFSTTGAMEGQYYRKYRIPVSFSEQQIVDCSKPFGTFGCQGGWMDDAFRYINKYGLEKEQDYPYRANDGPCRYNAAKVVNGSHVRGIFDVKSNSESSLAIAVATQGPVAVAIDASHPSFRSYRGGIYNELACSTTMLDHAVLAVGYDDRSVQHYWIVKNSWGPAWGISGYIYMSKDKNNQCGIASKASFPAL